jgi:HAD superfamily hydrolase (TIGR01459 family)
VIHDGVNAFPHAVDCLTRLRAAGKRTLLLSNVPRPNDAAQALMQRMGIPNDLYTDILTSGEAVRRALMDPPDLWWAELGQRVFHLGPVRDHGIIEGLALTQVADPSDANFVLNTGPDDHRNPTDLGEFEDVLRQCAQHHLPMICANPDLMVIRGGVRVLCAGSLAVRYQELGGTCAPSANRIPRSTSRCCKVSGFQSGRCWRWVMRYTPTLPAPRAWTLRRVGC